MDPIDHRTGKSKDPSGDNLATKLEVNLPIVPSSVVVKFNAFIPNNKN